MAHVGCFVPAKSARIGIVDRIFTRVGAQDNITSGESTFLVEMQEAANIMNNATNRSLILLDEVGRGTATFDGISIAWSIAEFIHNRIGARTLFATHYHELNELAHRYENIVNYKVEVIEAGSTIIFTHSLKRGTSDHSFGIHVAQMAGIPLEIIQRAESIMKSLENKSATQSNAEISADIPNISSIETQKKSQEDSQLAIFELRDDELHRKLLELKINNITPVQALQIISDWQKEIRRNIKR
jgi:DNA mismatch repair protein MutS